MNLARISELTNLISNLNATLSKLKNRKMNLELELPKIKTAQSRIDSAVSTANSRVSRLSAFGFRAEFLEEIMRPVQNRPDCSGMGTTVGTEISDMEAEISNTNSRIWWASDEKRRLEAEDVE